MMAGRAAGGVPLKQNARTVMVIPGHHCRPAARASPARSLSWPRWLLAARPRCRRRRRRSMPAQCAEIGPAQLGIEVDLRHSASHRGTQFVFVEARCAMEHEGHWDDARRCDREDRDQGARGDPRCREPIRWRPRAHRLLCARRTRPRPPERSARTQRPSPETFSSPAMAPSSASTQTPRPCASATTRLRHLDVLLKRAVRAVDHD